MKTFVKSKLKRLAPLDEKLRKHRPYRTVSDRLYSAVWVNLLGGPVPPDDASDELPHEAQSFLEARETAPLVTDQVLYESFHGDRFDGNPKAILDYVLDRAEYEHLTHVVAVKDPSTLAHGYHAADRVYVVAAGSTDYARMLATSEYLVSNSTFPWWFVRRDEQTYANTWHGVPLKTMFSKEKGDPTSFANSQRNFLQATHLLMPNAYSTRELVGAALVGELVADRTFEIGSPRVDQFLPRPTSTTKRILLAPTWRGELHEADAANADLDRLCKRIETELGCMVLLRLHNFTKNVPKSLAKRIVPAHVTNDQVLTTVDALISDYSSIAVDAVAAGIPVVLYVPDREAYESDRGFNYRLEDLPVEVAADEDALLDALGSLASPSEHPNWESSRDELFPLEDGDASMRAAQIIFDGKHLDTRTKEYVAKPIIGVWGGGLRPNGITSSLINFLAAFSDISDTWSLALFTDGHGLKQDRHSTLKQVPSYVHLIHRCGREMYFDDEVDAKNTFFSRNAWSSPYQHSQFDRAMHRESKRIFGDRHVALFIHFGGYRRLWAHIIANANTSKRLIWQHNDLEAEFRARFDDLLGVFQSYAKYDQIVAVSEPTRVLNEQNLSVYYPAGGAVTVRNLIDPVAIAKKAASEFTLTTPDGDQLLTVDSGKGPTQKAIVLPSDQLKLITVARFSPEKDHRLLLEAFAKVRSERKSHLFFLGDGPLFSETVDYAEQLGLREHCSFIGQVSNPYPLMKAADCFVQSSLYEGQPMVILESLAVGTPVIATDIPGNQAFADEEGVQLVQRTAQNLADAILRLKDDPMPSPSPGAVRAYVREVKAEYVALLPEQPELALAR